MLEPAASCSSASAASRGDEQSDTELQLGQEVFQELKNKREIVAITLSGRHRRRSSSGGFQPFNRCSSSLLYRVRRTTPRSRAAREMLPPVLVSARRMARRSAFRTWGASAYSPSA